MIVAHGQNAGIARVAAAGQHGFQLNVAVFLEENSDAKLGLVVRTEGFVELVSRSANPFVAEAAAGDEYAVPHLGYSRAVAARFLRQGALPLVVGRLCGGKARVTANKCWSSPKQRDVSLGACTPNSRPVESRYSGCVVP